MKIRKLCMPTLVLAVIVTFSGLMFSGCNAALTAASCDDVYSTSDDDEYLKNYTPSRSSDYVYQDPNFQKQTNSYREAIQNPGTTSQTSLSDTLQEQPASDYIDYDEDDYYDYAYSARIRRFHSPVIYYDYYADYYTNMYWYTYDPFYWGTSIYLGYSWWYPTYYSRWYDPFYWSWYSPYYYPYHHHFCCHHHYPHHDICYYNSHDYNSNLYRGISTGTGYIRRGEGAITRAGNIDGTKLSRSLGTGSANTLSKGNVTLNRNVTSAGSLTTPSAGKPAISRTNNQANVSKPLAKPMQRSTNATKTIGGSTRPINNPSNTSTITTNRSKNTYTPPAQSRKTTPSTIKSNRNINRSNSVGRPSTNRSINRSSSQQNYRSGSRSTYSSPSRSSSSSSSRSMGSSSSSRSSSGSSHSIRR